MKVTLNWLRQYVDFDGSAEELAERLTMLGMEVEAVHKFPGEFEGVVVAQILSCDKVPGADKLTVCKVHDGQRERTIICGARNHKPGDKVALILPGHALPLKPGEKEPFVIRERKVFGIVSEGMMCSPQELGLPDPTDGLLILRPDAKVGQPFAEYLGRPGGDVVFDLEITPNRPDLNSVIGIAREIAAQAGRPLRLPAVEVTEQPDAPRVESLVAVRVEDATLCPRYTARVVRGVKIGPSPDWLRATLEKVGVRSINNVVDVTNYVMLECGQPLHAFDYHLLARPADADARPVIVVRRAREGEKFVTLDGVERALSAEMLLIADAEKGIALAGVMGGQNTEIHERTSDVLIESANFAPANIRRTSKALGLRTESSYRFERGADIGITEWASRRCAQLILQVAGGQAAAGVVDVYPNPAPPRAITLRHHKVGELLGVPVPIEEQVRILERLGLQRLGANGAARVPLVKADPDTTTLLNKAAPASDAPCTTFLVPTWRVDLKRETDLIEEIERLYGVEKVPATPPRGALGTNPFDAVHDQIAEVRRILCGLGLNEAQGQTLVSEAAARLAAPAEALVRLANPLSSDMNTLRPSLLPGLLDSLRHNVTRKNADVALFEVGRVFRRGDDGAPVELRRVAIALTGRRAPTFWSGEGRGAKFDLFDLKGFVEELLEQWGIRGVSWPRRAGPTTLFLESAGIQLGKQPLGELGQLLPALVRQYDLRDAVFLAELDLDLLLARRAAVKTFKPLPLFPAVRRDVALLVPETTAHEAVLQVIRQAKPPHLESVELFDVFRGGNVPEGQKSLAYALTYRSPERTLTDAEVNAAHAKVIEALKTQLNATIRE